MAGVILASIAAVLVATATAFGASLTFFGEPVDPSEQAISDNAGRAALWALVTPVFAVAIRRSPRRRKVVAATGWLGLLVWSQPWFWIPPDEGRWHDTDPLWQGGTSPFMQLFALSMVAFGARAVWGEGRSWRIGAAVVAVVVVALLGGSAVHVHGQADDFAAEFAAAERSLLSDPLWGRLPPGQEESAWWGDPSYTRRIHGETFDRALFAEVTAVVEASGWVLTESRCNDRSWEAWFAKDANGRPRALSVGTGRFSQGVRVAMTADHGPRSEAARCWAGSEQRGNGA
jgi:hypothetical protein